MIVGPVRQAKETATMTVNVRAGSTVFRLPAQMYVAPILSGILITVAIAAPVRPGKAIVTTTVNVRADCPALRFQALIHVNDRTQVISII